MSRVRHRRRPLASGCALRGSSSGIMLQQQTRSVATGERPVGDRQTPSGDGGDPMIPPPATESPRSDESRRRVAEKLIRRIFIAQLVCLALFGISVAISLVFAERFGAFWLAFLCGAIGGSLSLIKRIRVERIEVLREIESSLITTLMPLLYGGILASITYLLFLGCVLTGDGEGGLFTSNLFPEFRGLTCRATPDGAQVEDLTMEDVIAIRPRTIQDFAKLLIWSVLSGYSEKFVDGILRTLEHRGR